MAIIEIDHLFFEAGEQKILSDITYSIEEGDFLSITGPSGSGKSTLLKIIATILSKTSGQLLYKGKDIETYEPADYRKQVSYCSQSPVLFGKTVYDNLIFPYDIRREKFDEEKALLFLETVGIAKAYLHKNITDLSGGEKQRVALIRNVMFQPKVLLLDEVTSALDEENRQIIWEWLRKMRKNKNMTIVMVSHNDDEAGLADMQVSIINGKLFKNGGQPNGSAS